MKKTIVALLIVLLTCSMVTFVSCDDDCQHEWQEIKSEEALKADGTTTTKAVYYKT